MAKLAGTIVIELAEQGFWHSDITRYLLALQSGQSIQVYDEAANLTRTLDADQGWEFVAEWAKNNNFSISRRKSRRSQISALLEDIGAREKLESEAASALNSLKTKAREGTPPGATPAISDNLKNAEALQREQIARLEKKLFSPLTSLYYNSPLLKDITNADLRLRAATVLSGNPQLVSLYQASRTQVPGYNTIAATHQIHELLSRSIPELGPFFYTLRSDYAEAATAKTLSEAQDKLRELYPDAKSGNVDVKSLQDDLRSLYQVAATGATLTDISDVIKSLPPSYLVQDQAGLDREIRKLIVRAATGTHVSGDDILAELIRENKLSPQAALKLQFLAPQIELAQIRIRSELSGSSFFDRTNTRERWSANLAASLGIDPETFWLKDQDLQDATDFFLKKYGVKTLDEAIARELSGTNSAEEKTKNYNSLSSLKDKLSQRKEYHQARSDNTLFFLQDSLNQLNYRLNVIKEPYDTASRRFWAKLENIDEIVHYPTRKIADYWEDLVDGRKKFLGISTVIEFKNKAGKIVRIPLLNLPSYLIQQYVALQKYFAENVFKWSWSLAKKGGVYAPLKSVANYTFAFIQHDADFRATNFYFGRKVVGNFLDWGARKIGQESFAMLKSNVGKAALKFGNKVTGGLLGKATAYLASLGLSVEGVGIFLTAAMLAVDLVKGITGFFKKFFNDENFRNKFLNWAPTIGIFISGVGAFLAGIPAAVGFLFTGLLTFLAGALSGIAVFFIQGLIWAGSAVLFFTLMFQLIQTTTRIDVGDALQQIATDLLCDESGEPTLPGVSENTASEQESSSTTVAKNSSVASCANCLAKYLVECIGPSVTSSNVSRGLSCLAAAAISPTAIDIIKRSAESFTYLQCVGFVQASIACAGGSLPGANACGYAQGTSWGSYKFVRGTVGARPGDPIVFNSSGSCSDGAPGHIGIMKEDAGSLICLIDANYACSGCPSQNSCLPKSQMAGFLKKM